MTDIDRTFIKQRLRTMISRGKSDGVRRVDVRLLRDALAQIEEQERQLAAIQAAVEGVAA